jgi:hypothetical protein
VSKRGGNASADLQNRTFSNFLQATSGMGRNFLSLTSTGPSTNKFEKGREEETWKEMKNNSSDVKKEREVVKNTRDE